MRKKNKIKLVNKDLQIKNTEKYTKTDFGQKSTEEQL